MRPRDPGRRRGLTADGTGLIIAVVVAAASVHDNAIDARLLDTIAGSGYSRVSKALVDQGFKNSVVEHGARLGIEAEIVERNPANTGFVLQPIPLRGRTGQRPEHAGETAGARL